MSVHFIIPTIDIPETGYPHRHGVQVGTSLNLTPLGCPSLADHASTYTKQPSQKLMPHSALAPSFDEHAPGARPLP